MNMGCDSCQPLCPSSQSTPPQIPCLFCSFYTCLTHSCSNPKSMEKIFLTRLSFPIQQYWIHGTFWQPEFAGLLRGAPAGLSNTLYRGWWLRQRHRDLRGVEQWECQNRLGPGQVPENEGAAGVEEWSQEFRRAPVLTWQDSPGWAMTSCGCLRKGDRERDSSRGSFSLRLRVDGLILSDVNDGVHHTSWQCLWKASVLYNLRNPIWKWCHLLLSSTISCSPVLCANVGQRQSGNTHLRSFIL